MEKRSSLLELDGIEVLKVAQQASDIPMHYHDCFCISLVESGIECIQMGAQSLLTEKNTISINHPFEIHANPIMDADIVNSFTTLYLSPELVDRLTGKKHTSFAHKQQSNPVLTSQFQTTVEAIFRKDVGGLEESLSVLLQSFGQEEQASFEERKSLNRKWSDLMEFIEHQLEQKISLELLARFMDLDKFRFAREFRKRIGISPINYVLMKKIFLAKAHIQIDTNLTQLAYQFDFADQAHFSKCFKRFIGVSPREYKNQIL